MGIQAFERGIQASQDTHCMHAMTCIVFLLPTRQDAQQRKRVNTVWCTLAMDGIIKPLSFCRNPYHHTTVGLPLQLHNIGNIRIHIQGGVWRETRQQSPQDAYNFKMSHICNCQLLIIYIIILIILLHCNKGHLWTPKQIMPSNIVNRNKCPYTNKNVVFVHFLHV